VTPATPTSPRIFFTRRAAGKWLAANNPHPDGSDAARLWARKFWLGRSARIEALERRWRPFSYTYIAIVGLYSIVALLVRL
jgi:hypothetical protein